MAIKKTNVNTTKEQERAELHRAIWQIANDYNIAVSSYVEPEDTREVVDITELNKEIAQVVARQNELRTAIDEIVEDIENDK